MAPVVGYYEHGNESSGAINGNEFNGEYFVSQKLCFMKLIVQCIVVLTSPPVPTEGRETLFASVWRGSVSLVSSIVCRVRVLPSYLV